MKFLKKFPVAVVITVLAIVGSIVYSQLVTPPASPEPEPPAAATEAAEAGEAVKIDPSRNDGTSLSYLRDGAGVFTQETLDQIEAYNEAWQSAYGTRIAVVTVDSVSGDIQEAALDAANELGISGYDMILYLDIGGKACYFDCGDDLWNDYVESHNILNSYPNRYLYNDYMAGRYGEGALRAHECASGGLCALGVLAPARRPVVAPSWPRWAPWTRARRFRWVRRPPAQTPRRRLWPRRLWPRQLWRRPRRRPRRWLWRRPRWWLRRRPWRRFRRRSRLTDPQKTERRADVWKRPPFLKGREEMEQTTQIVGRFAPSPSGRMHLGNAFSALLAWLSVRAVGGELVLRQEDLDPQRCKAEYAEQIEADLRWLGLDWDRGGSAGGPAYFQSHRSAIYAEYLERLNQQGLIYPCYCTRNQLHAASAPHAADGTPIYGGTCRNLTPAERAERGKTRKPALRVRVPAESIAFTDTVMGEYSEELDRACGDFILRRSDGVHAYQLAVVVDDALMGVNQVVRGVDLLSSTPRQIWLQRQLGFSALPQYCHVPLLCGRDGHRLSKRQRDVDLGTLRRAGRRPEELVGQLACWAGLIDRPEPVAARELIPEFGWHKVRRENILAE